MQTVMRGLAGWLAASTLVVGCGDRSDEWDSRPTTPVTSVGLQGSVALVDPALDRVLMLTASAATLDVHPIPIGKNFVTATASPDGSKLFVLSSGEVPRRQHDDELPSLRIIDGGTQPQLAQSFTLSDPLRGLAIDPQGQWAVVYDAGGVVVNPNELIFVPLQGQRAEAYPKTLRSFGGRPQRLTFTPELVIADGDARRFLVVETESDVTLVDLGSLESEEITVGLPRSASGQFGKPAAIVVDDGVPELPGDARMAVQLANDDSVLILDFVPDGNEQGFTLRPNLSDVGGIPSSIEFVWTDAGLRLAALVPGNRTAALVNPNTSVVERVDFPAPYSRVRRITSTVESGSSTDVALLYSESASSLAFWSLGTASGTPYRSVDAYEIPAAVAAVRDVPGESFGHLKVLEATNQSQFFVLDLRQREISPLVAQGPGFQITVARDGERAWAYQPGGSALAVITLDDLHPKSLVLERQVSAVFDVQRTDLGRAAIALHVPYDGSTGVGATVLDALEPDTASSTFYTGLYFGGLR